MLQQTTVAAVIPYYTRFLERFPSVDDLAKAPIEDVLQNWAGLGYYARARNLHKAAQTIARTGFPRTVEELLEIPGFGPYTARAVASLAFDAEAGVLDGNVIRVLSRRYGMATEWWRPAERDRMQDLADRLANVPKDQGGPHDWNQAMMELGATVCTPVNPSCLLCPWASSCAARAQGRQAELPLKKPRRAREVWAWRPEILEAGGRIALVRNDYAPFLKGHWIFPGRAERLPAPPKRFDCKGTVTHHDIFVDVSPNATSAGEATWVEKSDLAKWTPASLVAKALAAFERRREAET